MPALILLSLLLAQDLVTRDDKGRIVARVPVVDDGLRNPWTPAMEEEFLERAQHVYEKFKGVRWGGNVLEQEKDMYPKAMFGVLTGNQKAALEALQRPDVDTKDHAHTLGIDLYWCFTLKGQLRKYFYFGPALDPSYRDRMKEAAKRWTEQDPVRRPHPVHGRGKGGQGWGPDDRGSWVDIRGTDNLRAMREIAVYLFAEEAGNEETRKLYLGRLQDHVVKLWQRGMSEWDSENYHGHSLTSWHNLYDFARATEAKKLGKAALDLLYTMGALKYWRGGFGGPVCREYGNGSVVFGSNASHPLWLAFGDSPRPDPVHDRDDVHLLTSAYRPPAAVVALARRDFPRPAELTATKPPYNWSAPEPRFFETQYYGATFQMGSVVSAAAEETWNIAPFKLMAWNTDRGVDYFVANTTPIAGHAAKKAGDQIAQSGPRLIWLRPSAAPFQFLAPKSARIETQDGVRFYRYEKTWLAVHPFGDTAWAEETPDAKVAARYPDDRFDQAALSGFALEAGEGDSYEEFKTRALQGRPKRTDHVVEFGSLKVELNRRDDLPIVSVDGRRTELPRDVYRSAPVTLSAGSLRVIAGGKTFLAALGADGVYSFENR